MPVDSVGPRWVSGLLRRLLPADLRDDVLRDLGERWQYLVERDGRLRATLWYWGQAIRSLAPARRHRRSASAALPNSSERRWSAWRQDLGYAGRQVRRTPGFTAAVVATLSLGIGATSAVFSVVDGVLLDPLPYPDPDALVRVYSASVERPQETAFLSGSHYIAFRERTDVFADITAFYDYDELGADLTGDAGPERIVRMPVTSNYFEILGAPPILGTGFTREQEIGSDAGVAIISFGLWSSRYGRDPEVIGESLVLDGVASRIIGVAPAGFVGPGGGNVAVWTPLDMQPGGNNNFDNHYLSAVGRLAEGVTPAEASQMLDALNATLVEEFSEARPELSHLVPLHRDIVGNVQAMLTLLMASVGLVLLIVCVNVANLSLVRGAERVHEVAVRAALGAERGRLMMQFLFEGLLRALGGGVVGVALGWAAVRGLLALGPDTLPRAGRVGLDGRVLAFALGTTVLTGLLFAIVPAMRLSRQSGSAALNDAGLRTTGGGHQRLRSGLVVGQVATALALLLASGALLSAFIEIQRSSLGFEPAGVATFEVHLPGAAYGDGARRIAFAEQLLDRVEAIAGVQYAGAASVLPVTGRSFMWGLFGKDHEQGQRPFLTDVRVVAGDYFPTLGIPLVEGRLFDSTDRGADSAPVVLINQRVIDEYLGETFRLGDAVRLAGVDRQVVGVVGNTAVDSRGETAPKVYMPYGQAAMDRNWSMTYLVKSELSDAALLPALRQALGDIDGDRVVYRPGTMRQITRAASATERFSTLLMSIFAAMALTITAIGIYGVLAVSVGQRTRELGIRAALGAEAGSLRALVVGQALRLGIGGIAAGVVLLAGARAWIGSVLPLPEVDAPWLLVLVSGVLLLVALAASYLPARRATAVDPARVLR